MDIEESSGIRSSFLAMRDHVHYLRLLLREQLRTAPSDAAFAASGFQARPCSLSQHRPLELRERVICIIIRPAGVVVSIASVRLRKPAFAS
jgi:hypothetical protein